MQQGFGIILLAEEVVRERRMTAARYAAEHRLLGELADEGPKHGRGSAGRRAAARCWSLWVPLLRLRVTVQTVGR